MGLIKFALKFRISFYVLAILTMIAGGGAFLSMPRDVLPNVDIPVVTVVWTYSGLSAEEMESKITTYTEISLTNNVTNIKRIDSQTLQGFAVERISFQPNVNIDLAIAQTVSAMNSILGILPEGINPPIIVRYSASQVPVIQLALTGQKQSESELYAWGQYGVRQVLSTARGATIPPPFGGQRTQIMVDLDLDKLRAYGLTPADITSAVTAQNLTVPSGLAKIGQSQYVVKLNSSPGVLDALNNIPVKSEDGATILMRDVGYVREGGQAQQNIVRVDGARAVLMTLLKNGEASTVDVVNAVKSRLSQVAAQAPDGAQFKVLFDQSVFVTEAIASVLEEGLIAAGLTGLMILLFLGSWRSTLIVLVSIPLSVLASLAVLWALGQTLNIMTLGGLALAVGILVDDTTVAIENTYRLMEDGKSFKEAVVEGAAGIAKPTLVSTLTVCTAFVSVFFLTDAARYVFTPQAMAVVFAMLASYLFARTLVPILIDVLIASEYERRHGEGAKEGKKRGIGGLFDRLHGGFERGFERFRAGYVRLLRGVLRFPRRAGAVIAVVFVTAGTMFVFVGEDYFPQIDANELQLHVRARPGTRIENAEAFFAKVEDTIKEVIPKDKLDLVLSNIGLPPQNYNLAFMDGTTNAYYDGPILIALKPGAGGADTYRRTLRRILAERFPEGLFYFQPADIITQVLTFGQPAPVNVKFVGKDRIKNLQLAKQFVQDLRKIKGVVDAHLQQIVDAPQLFVDVDRVRARQLGLTQQQIANNLNISLSSSYQTAPSLWTDPETGNPYQVAVQTPEWRIRSIDDLRNTPLLRSPALADGVIPVTLLANVAAIKRQGEQATITHVDRQNAYDIYASIQDRDLGSVGRAVQDLADKYQQQLGKGNRIVVAGQIADMHAAFWQIGLGLLAALLAVYLLMVVNFQDWVDPFIILLALPLAFCGVTASLFLTGTTFSIPSLMGGIMAVGVASANSILLVSFAREHRIGTGCDAFEAAITAGRERLRPVLMTAGAMFVGLIPMSLALGAGAQQNAALARAVMGGVAAGTCTTLLVVPFLYTLLRKKPARPVENYL